MITLLQVDEQQAFGSTSSTWRGMVLERVTMDAGTWAALSIHQHTLVTLDGDTSQIHFEVDGHLIPAQSRANQVSAFFPAGHPAIIRALTPSKVTLLGVEPDLISEKIGSRSFRPTAKFTFEDPFLVGVISRLHELANDGVLAEKVYAGSLGVAAVLHLGKIFQASNDAYVLKGRLGPAQLKQVVDFAHESLQSDIGLHELASLVHLSPYHFGRLFKQTSGLSPYQFILQLKIERAKKMILRNRGPIGDIAHQLNFADQSHFSNAFRKATGISPREFMHQQAAE